MPSYAWAGAPPGLPDWTGGGVLPVPTQTDDYESDFGELVPVDTTAGDVTITLPLTGPTGSAVVVKKLDASDNKVIVTCPGWTIEGADTAELISQFTTVTFSKTAAGYVSVSTANSGIVGVQGDQGIQGETGETGPQGPQGIQGVQGPAGSNAAGYIMVDQAFGNNATAAAAHIQSKLDAAVAAGGGTVYVPDGTYLCATTLTIGSNTTMVLAPAAIIKRNAQTDAIMLNKHDGTTGVYGQAKNIHVKGGCFDGNQANFHTNEVTLVAFGHAEDIFIEDVIFKNTYAWHHLELNATRHAIVRGCIFTGVDAGTSNREALQLDLALSSAAFPWFGPYDNTACEDVLIEGNRFVNLWRGTGSHSSASAVNHKNVRIVHNTYDTCGGEAIVTLCTQALLIQGNRIVNCGAGIICQNDGSAILYGAIIKDNQLKTIGGRAIYFDSGDTSKVANYREITISGNIIESPTNHGISLDYCTDVAVLDNIIRDITTATPTAIYLFGTNRARVQGNNVGASRTGSGKSISVGGSTQAADDVILTNNILDILRGETGSRLIVTNNIITVTPTYAAGFTAKQVFSNYVAGSWVA